MVVVAGYRRRTAVQGDVTVEGAPHAASPRMPPVRIVVAPSPVPPGIYGRRSLFIS